VDALAPWRPARAADPDLAGADSFALRRCSACGSATLAAAAPVATIAYEGGSYAPTRRAARLVAAPAERLSYAQRLRLLDLPAGAALLEVGAGDGRFVAAARRHGLRAEGIDPAAHGDLVRRARLDEVELDAESLDAIVLWHVLEHFDEPAEALGRLMPALRPEGRLLIAVPDLASLQARIGGDRWFHQDVPRHRVLFTRNGLAALLARSGLRISVSTGLVPEQNLLGMWQTLLNRCTATSDVAFRLAKGQRPARGRDLAATAVLGPLLAVPATLLELGATLRGRSGTLAVVTTRAHR
jgi:predicted SAM-dependent methyltransferase